MIITPFRWPGAKNKLLPHILELLKPLLIDCQEFCEPFAGGACVSLEVAKLYPNLQIHLADKDYGLASFWKIVAGNNEKQLTSLLNKLDTEPTVDLFFEIQHTIYDNPVDAAYRILFLNRTAFSGIVMSGPIGGKVQQSKYKINCRYNPTKLKKKIMSCHNLLKNRTTVYCVDFTDLSQLKDNQCVAYIDPPYVKAGAALYNHSMIAQEHKALAEILLLRNNWVLSYDDHILIRELYQKCHIKDINATYSIDGVKNTCKIKNELLITA